MRNMPKRFTSQWRKLWFSGAIPRDVVYYDELAKALEEQLKTTEDAWYFEGISPQDVRHGCFLGQVPISFRDMAARVAGELRLTEKQYRILYYRLFV